MYEPTCDPADVCRTPVDVCLRLMVEGVLEGGGRVQHVPGCAVQYTLGFAYKLVITTIRLGFLALTFVS